MNFPAPLSLRHYFVVAARMQHHFESNLVAVEESGVAALQDPDLAAFELFSGPRGNFMHYWYASLTVVVQGFRNLKLVDPRADALLASPNVKALRRCWNGVFHFQPDYFSAKLLEPMASFRLHRMGASGRVNAAVIMLSQGAMAAGGMIWGLLAHTYGTRPTLATVAALFAAYLALTAQRDGPFGDRHPRSSPEPGPLHPPLCPAGNG